MTTRPMLEPTSVLRGGGASRGDARWHDGSKIAIGGGGDSKMDCEMSNGGGNGRRQVSQWEAATVAAQLQRATMVAVQWTAGWRCNHDGSLHEQRQRRWEMAVVAARPRWATAAEGNGWQDGGAMAMCGIAIGMDSGGGDGQWWRDGNLMGDSNGNVIAMGNVSDGAMDGKTAVRSQWQWAMAERGQRNGRWPFCNIVFPLESIHLALAGEGGRLLMTAEREVALL
jgi:hypothetical protein